MIYSQVEDLISLIFLIIGMGRFKVKIGNQLTVKLSGPQDVSAEDRIQGPSAIQNYTPSSKVYFN